jgi:polysaccharide export outer membrane protein
MKALVLRSLTALCALLAAVASAQTPPAPDAPRTDPAYRLIAGDQVAISVYGESELSISQKLDTEGRIRLALVGDLALAGLSVREAERTIEKLYVDRRILKQPMINIVVQTYAVRDISILGAVRGPGKMTFPPEKSVLDITDVVTRAGGFLPTAKSDAVKITRVDAAGRESTVEINVEAMLTRRGAGPNTLKEFPIYPGDRIWVPERLF